MIFLKKKKKESGLAMSCGVGRRRGSDLVLLWLWRRPAATAPIRPLAWEPPYATGSGPRKGKKTKRPKKKKVIYDKPTVNITLGIEGVPIVVQW